MITQSRPDGKTKICPVCNTENHRSALLCISCGNVLPRVPTGDLPTGAPGEQSKAPVPPRPRPAVSQQCPGCGALNRAGVIVCESCGTNLITGERPPITTRTIPAHEVSYKDVTDSAMEGKETLSLDQFLKASKVGTGVFDETMILRLQIEGADKPLLLKLRPGRSLVFGRLDATSVVDIDLTPYSGYDKGISRRHAALELKEKRLELWDLQSSNGTFLNGNRLDPNDRHQLRDGDELRLGTMTIKVSFQHKIDRQATEEVPPAK